MTTGDVTRFRAPAGMADEDDWQATRHQRLDRRDRSLGLPARLVDPADRKEGATATQRTQRPVRRRRHLHAVAAGAQDFHGRMEIFRLEIAIEGVSKKNDVAAVFASPRLRGEVGVLLRAG